MDEESVIDKLVKSILESIRADLGIEELDPAKLVIHDVVYEDKDLIIDYDYGEDQNI